ncbi:MAG: VanZ family protein, partial [Lactobacillus delbrueckii]
MRKRNIILAFLGCLGSVLLISGLTFQNSGQSAQLTLKFVNLFEKVHFHLTGTMMAEYPIYHMMRKLAHTAEYFLLGTSACYFFSRWQKHYAWSA